MDQVRDKFIVMADSKKVKSICNIMNASIGWRSPVAVVRTIATKMAIRNMVFYVDEQCVTSEGGRIILCPVHLS